MIDFEKFIVDEMESTKEDIVPLYRIYVAEMEDMITQLQEAADDNDSDAYQRLLHNVKGISANMRFDLITNPVAESYSALKEGESLDLKNITLTIQDVFTKAKTEIIEYFGDIF